MKYVLLNRKNIVVDILDRPRYIKLQPSTGIVIACEEYEGTGVIGSDCNTHYTLMKADTTDNPNAVIVMAIKKIPSWISIGKTRFNSEIGGFEPLYTLEQTQDMKQEENKKKFAEYLLVHPMTWIDGKKYGITQDDQNEISLNLNQYQIAVAAGVDSPTLKWHAKHEKCTEWTFEQLTALSLAISEVVYPIYDLCQQYKTDIYSATTIEEVDNIELKYEDKESTFNEEQAMTLANRKSTAISSDQEQLRADVDYLAAVQGVSL